MVAITIGKLVSVDLREIWPHEARDFTAWLCSDDGMERLNEAIGLDIVFDDADGRVGSFECDMVASVDGEEDHIVIIENQLEKTNHDHLGKIITYAAGKGARTVIWIAKQFTDEHRQAIDWLNNSTVDNLNFFAIEIRAIRIDGSAAAPEFRVVARPNEWAKVSRRAGKGEISDTKEDQFHYWEELHEFFGATKLPFRLQKAQPWHWCNISTGKTGVHISLALNSKKRVISCELNLGGDYGKAYFDLLAKNRDEINSQLTGYELDWRRLDEGKYSRIITVKDGYITIPAEREAAKDWMLLAAKRFHEVFSSKLQALKLPAFESA